MLTRKKCGDERGGEKSQTSEIIKINLNSGTAVDDFFQIFNHIVALRESLLRLDQKNTTIFVFDVHENISII